MAFRFAAIPALFAGLMLGASAVQAQTFPTRPVAIVVPVPPGGVADLLARTAGAQLAERWKQSVVVENRPGGGILISARSLRTYPPGYGMILTGGGIINAPLFNKDTVNPADYAQAGQLAWLAQVLVIHPQVPAKNLAEFIKYAKANPDKLTFGSVPATVFDLDYAFFEQAAGVKMRNIPYQGSAAALQAVLKNEVQFLLNVFGSNNSFFTEGKLIPLAVAAPTRLSSMPTIPTAMEQGVNYTATVEHGLHVLAETPKDTLQKIRADIVAGQKDPALQKKIRDMGLEPANASAEEWAQSLDRQAKTYAEIAKKTGLQPQ